MKYVQFNSIQEKYNVSNMFNSVNKYLFKQYSIRLASILIIYASANNTLRPTQLFPILS